MKSSSLCFDVFAFLVGTIIIFCSNIVNVESNDVAFGNTVAAYGVGVFLGIINPKKYSLEKFKSDDRYIFRKLYVEYINASGNSQKLSYEQWLIMNNFGIMYGTEESLLETKTKLRSPEENKKRFLESVTKGDILVTGRGVMGWLVGHAALMSSDYWVLEMAGGDEAWTIKSNNRRISKGRWFDEHADNWINIYRCPDGEVAREAADWAYFTYYNSTDGFHKTKHITYSINTNVWQIDPSYCSKLVIHAFYYGIKTKRVVREFSLLGEIIFPTRIPQYFLKPYKLVNVGKF